MNATAPTIEHKTFNPAAIQSLAVAERRRNPQLDDDQRADLAYDRNCPGCHRRAVYCECGSEE